MRHLEAGWPLSAGQNCVQKWDEDLVGIKLTVTYKEKLVDTQEYGTLAENDEPIGEIEKATRVSRTTKSNQ